jgi:hypothetical protein
MQDMLCQKYDVILTDHKTRKEKIAFVLKKFNQRNFNKAMKQFNVFMKDFGKFMDQLTRDSTHEINSTKYKDENSNDLIWGKSNNSIPIWATSENDFDSQARHEANLEKIWGKK